MSNYASNTLNFLAILAVIGVVALFSVIAVGQGELLPMLSGVSR